MYFNSFRQQCSEEKNNFYMKLAFDHMTAEI